MRLSLSKGSSGVINLPKNLKVNAQRLQGVLVTVPNTDDEVFVWRNNTWLPDKFLPSIGIEGLTLSNNAIDADHDLNFSAGAALTTIGQRRVARLDTTLVKQLDSSWEAGNNSGGLFNNVNLEAPNTYHCFLLVNNSTGEVDAGFDDNLNAENRPAGWSARRVGSILYRGSSIVAFNQFGWFFEHKTPIVDLNGVEIATTSTLYMLSVPTGLPVEASFIFAGGLAGDIEGGDVSISVQSPDQNTQTPNLGPHVGSFRGTYGSFFVFTPVDLTDTTTVLSLLRHTNTEAKIKMIRTGEYLGSAWQTTLITTGWYDHALLRGY